MKRHLPRAIALVLAVVILMLSLTACGAQPILTEDYQYTQDELKSMKLAKYSYDDNAPSLYEAFADYFKVGACINPWTISNTSSDDFKSIMKQFNTFVLENASKPDAMHPSENTYNFTNVDAYVEFGEKYDVTLRGHTLIWHSQVPDWFFYASGVSGEPATAEQLMQRIDEHVTTIVSRYAGKIDTWDVVNEVINDGGGLRYSKWLEIIGDYDGDGDKYDYIEQAFISARAADPDARLIINDYNMEWSEQKTISMYLAVKKMLEDGVPIDGIGLQMHISYDTNIDTLRSNLEKLARLREINPDFILEVTELDMNCNGWNGDPDDKEFIEKYNQTYKDLFALLMEYSEMGLIDSVVFWGINDGNSWLNSSEKDNYPFLIARDNELKSAYWDVISLALK